MTKERHPDPEPERKAPKAQERRPHGLPEDEAQRVADAALAVWNRQGEGEHLDSLGRLWRFRIEGERSRLLAVSVGDASASLDQVALGTEGGDSLRDTIARLGIEAGKDTEYQGVEDG